MTGIGEAISAITAAWRVAGAAKDITDKAKLDAAVSDVYDKLGTAQAALLELQQQHMELMNRNRELQEELSQAARFDRYRLEATPLGGYVLRLIPELARQEEPDHAICPRCKEDGKLSVMTTGQIIHYCQTCGYKAQFERAKPVSRSRTVKPNI